MPQQPMKQVVGHRTEHKHWNEPDLATSATVGPPCMSRLGQGGESIRKSPLSSYEWGFVDACSDGMAPIALPFSDREAIM